MRFLRPGVHKLYEAASIATPAAPTIAELGVDLTAFADVRWWELEDGVPTMQQWDNLPADRLRGYQSIRDPELTFYEDATANPLRSTFTRGTQRWMVYFPLGHAGASPTVGDLCEVGQVRSRGPRRLVDVNAQAAAWSVGFAVLGTPELDAVLA